MGKIIKEYESKYDVGDVVIFNHNENRLILGIIEGYYIDHNAGNSIWYNIRVNSNMVYTYSNGGDIAEYDIISKLEDELKEKCYKLLQTDLNDRCAFQNCLL